jgi:AraC-like DNA-binding protein
MIFCRHIPGPPLAAFIDFFWYYDGLYPQHRKEHVLPDGTFELVINLRDEPRKLFHRGDTTRYDSFRRGWFSGTHSEYIVIDAVANSSMIGAHFKPGGIALFLGLPADEMRDRVVELDAFWGIGAWCLRDQLLAARPPQLKFRILEQFLRERLLHSKFPAGRSPRVDGAVNRFLRQPDQIAIRNLAEEFGISHKHFIDEFRRHVGLTPKLFCRIRRFQEVLVRITARERVEWADVACSCGYYDQAHFVHDFQEFSGLNPTAFLSRQFGDPQFVPVEDD